jgi:16S rRNA (guanine527-N7)-methyltransferase
VPADVLAETLHRGLAKLAEPLEDPGKETALLSYLAELGRWNTTYNLTAVNDPRDRIIRHVLDSLSVLPWIGEGPLLDAGTGAGLPGVPLAIARPHLEVTLLDSAGKKIRFLNHVRRKPVLENISPVQARLESYAPAAPPTQVISRAFTDLASFASATRHLATEPLRLLAMKGRRPEGEIEALPEWAALESVEKLSVPGLQEQRHLVIMTVIP